MKTVFITGAAAGIGLLTARRFADEGYFVGLYDINKKGIEELLGSGEFVHACGGFCDVTQSNSIAEALADFSEKTDGRMDVLINNAGVLTPGHFEQVNPDDHNLMIDVNIKGFTHLAQLAFPYLRDTKNAMVINLCSASSIHGIPLLAVYSSSKFFVDGMTEALNIEWAEHDIRVASVKPGFVNTEMVANMPDRLISAFGVDLEPDDVADAIFDILKNRSDSRVLGLRPRALKVASAVLPRKVIHKTIAFVTGF